MVITDSFQASLGTYLEVARKGQKRSREYPDYAAYIWVKDSPSSGNMYGENFIRLPVYKIDKEVD